MLHTIDLTGYAGAHVANDPAGRGFLLCLHFPTSEDAAHAQESMKPHVADKPAPAVPLPPPPLEPGEIAVDKQTMKISRAGAGLEHLVGSSVKKLPDGRFGPADPPLPKQPAELPNLPDGMDSSTHAFIQDLQAGKAADPMAPNLPPHVVAVPPAAAPPAVVPSPPVPAHMLTPAEAHAALASVGAVSKPHELDEYLGPAGG